MKSEIRIGIIVADSDEYAPLEKSVKQGRFSEYKFLFRTGHRFIVSQGERSAEVISILCGIGKVNAAAAAAHLCDAGCDIILNFGLSGGISGINRGEICAADRYLEHDFDLTGIGYAPCEKPAQKYIYEADSRLLRLAEELLPGVKKGTAVTGDRFVCSDTERAYLHKRFNAMCCDMESAAIAYVCDGAGIPFLALRRVSDDAGSDAKEAYREMNSSDDTVLSDTVLSLIGKILTSNEF